MWSFSCHWLELRGKVYPAFRIAGRKSRQSSLAGLSFVGRIPLPKTRKGDFGLTPTEAVSAAISRAVSTPSQLKMHSPATWFFQFSRITMAASGMERERESPAQSTPGMP
jgi:hypothetical protein